MTLSQKKVTKDSLVPWKETSYFEQLIVTSKERGGACSLNVLGLSSKRENSVGSLFLDAEVFGMGSSGAMKAVTLAGQHSSHAGPFGTLTFLKGGCEGSTSRNRPSDLTNIKDDLVI